MRLFILSVFLFLSVTIFSQKKTNFSSEQEVLKSIKLENYFDAYLLVYYENGKENIIKKYGRTLDYEKPTQGIHFSQSTTDDYYFIIGEKSKKSVFILSLEELLKLGKDSKEDTFYILRSMSKGYFLDPEYVSFTGNTYKEKNNLSIEMAKITSETCPFKKSLYQLTYDLETRQLIEERLLHHYFEIYQADCKNNPHNDVIQKQMEQAAANKIEQEKQAKAAREAAKKRQMKSMRKD